MSGKVINLRRARKAKMRSNKRKESAARTGTTRLEAQDLEHKRHSGHKLTRDQGTDDD